MPCKKFISIRLKPGEETRIYVDDMTTPHTTLQRLGSFSLASPYVDQDNSGTSVVLEPMKWPPQGYDSPIAFALSAQWPFGTQYYESNDSSPGPASGRSFEQIDFVYDEAGKKLSWSQSAVPAPKPGRLQGSVEFNDITKAWYIVLTLDPQAAQSRGQLKINGQDIT